MALEISPEQQAYQLAHIHESRQGEVIGATSALTAIAIVFVAVRIATRLTSKIGLKWDDYTIMMALALSIAFFVCSYYQAVNGLGKHLLAVKPDQALALEKWLFASVILFTVAIYLVQLSFLFFYVRIFTLIDRKIRGAIYFGFILSTVVFIAIVFPTIFECEPFALAWNKALPGKCTNIHVLFIVADVLFLVVDLYIVFLPLPLVWSLQMPRAEKVAISGMFLLGGFVAIVNLIRLPRLISVDAADVTFSDLGAAIWSQAEICLGIVAACLPCMRPIFRGMIGWFTGDRSSFLSKWSLGQSGQSSMKTGGYEMHSVQKEAGGKGALGGSKIRSMDDTYTNGNMEADEWSGQPAGLFQNGKGGLRATSEGLDYRDVEKGRGTHAHG